VPDHQDGAEAASAPSILYHGLRVARVFVTAMSISYALVNNERFGSEKPKHGLLIFFFRATQSSSITLAAAFSSGRTSRCSKKHSLLIKNIRLTGHSSRI